MTQQPDHLSRAHSEFGASGAHRTIGCPGSVAAQRGRPSSSNIHADRGSAAHELGERCLREGSDPEKYAGEIITYNGHDFEIDDTMVEGVQLYVRTCRADVEPGDVWGIEEKFDLSDLHPGAFGTSDWWALKRKTRHLIVTDYKNGFGLVDAIDNPQLKYYGIGALRKVLALGEKVDKVTLRVVQPNAPHIEGKVREETIDVLDLLDFEFELVAAFQRASKPDAPRIAGDHCTYCLAAHDCPALTAATALMAADDFEPVPDININKLAQLLDMGEMLEARMGAARALAQQLAEGGVIVPGYKLVERSTRRKWAEDDKDVIAHKLAMKYGLSIDDLYKRTLNSPAQIEKAIKKPRGKADEIKREFNAEFTLRPPGGKTLVRDVDPRTALPAANPAADFEVIDATPIHMF